MYLPKHNATALVAENTDTYSSMHHTTNYYIITARRLEHSKTKARANLLIHMRTAPTTFGLFLSINCDCERAELAIDYINHRVVGDG